MCVRAADTETCPATSSSRDVALGNTANWHSDGRQGLYLLSEQWNRRPDSLWGQKLRENKAKFRAKYPEVIEVIEGGRKRRLYSKGHIQNMARWRTITQFVCWLYSAWRAHEARLESDMGKTA